MDGVMRDADVDSFMEITSCDSRSAARRHLANCSWGLEAAINRYFTFGLDLDDRAPFPPVAARAGTMHDDDDDMVRNPIPARSSTLYGYGDYFHGAGSSTPRAAPSIWAADRKPSSPWAAV